jgi:hypothetical protein
MASDEKLLIFTDIDAPEGRPLAARPTLEGIAKRTVTSCIEVSTNAFASALQVSYDSIVRALQTLPSKKGPVMLETVCFTLAVNTEGQVGLASTSGKVGGQVGIEFHLKMSHNDGK